MRMNSGIILAGQGVNALGAMQDGMQTAAMGKAIQKENRLADLYRTQGAGIAQGDRGALNALAGIDPQAAMAADAARLDRESTSLGMESTRQRMRILDAQEARAIAAQAAEMDANQRKAAAERIEGIVRMGMATQSPEEWDALMQREGAGQYVGMFGQRQQLAFRGMDMADILKGMEGPEPLSPEGKLAVDVAAGFLPSSAMDPKPADEYGRYVAEERAAGRKPLSRIDYAQAKKGEGIVMETPDGTVLRVGGKGADTTTTNLTQAQKVEDAFRSFDEGLGRYEAIFAETGGRVVPGEAKDRLMLARRDLQMQMKEMFNLGVLNGPDLDLMNQMMVDPTGLGNNAMDAVGVADLEARMARNIAQLREQMKSLAAPKLARLGLEFGPDGEIRSVQGDTAVDEGSIPPAPAGYTPDLWRRVYEAMTPEERELFK